jgi:hypothetical protein
MAFVLSILTLEGFARAQQGPIPWNQREGRRYTTTIDSQPQQAAIYLDDKKYGIVGYTPWTGKLVMGQYTLIIELQGYKPYSVPINVGSNSKDFKQNVLEKLILPGVIDVQAAADPNVLGAQVFVDNQLEGTAPIPVDVKEGRHQIEIRKDKFESYTQWIEITQGQRVTVAPVLKPLVVEKPKGSLLVDADVPQASVKVDGVKVTDLTPTLVPNLEEGPHTVEVSKDPAVPWKQVVQVVAGQTTKVTATLAATLQQASGGHVRVITNVPNAEVYLDGKLIGNTPPVDLNNIPPGEHIVQVKAQGYEVHEEKIVVNAGLEKVLEMNLSQSQAASAPTGAKLKVISPVPQAHVFIDGAPAGDVPVDKDIAPGQHFVRVQQDGYSTFDATIQIQAGETKTVTAELKAVGSLRFLSNVEGADVYIDSVPVGKTPFVASDVAVGDHIVQVKKSGYYEFQMPVKVVGGQPAILNAELKEIQNGPTPEQVLQGLSSFSARAMALGHYTVDLGVGYPYWLSARATIGAHAEKTWAEDVTVQMRSVLDTWEILLGTRVRFYEAPPFAFAGFANIGGGGGADGRNEFTFQAGGIASILFNNQVTVSGRVYIDSWSDRLCQTPSATSGTFSPSGPAVCKGTASPADQMLALHLLSGGLTDRDSGARAYLSLVIEVSFTDHLNGYLIFEGAPFQGERAGHSGVFMPLLPAHEDPIYNGTLGVTLKF